MSTERETTQPPTDALDEREKLLGEIDGLCQLVDGLARCTAEVKRASDASRRAERDYSSGSEEDVAEWVVEERQRLIDAWAAVEAEQRQLVLSTGTTRAVEEPKAAAASLPTAVAQASQPGRPAGEPSSGQPGGRKLAVTDQFRLLRREYDRQQDQ